MKKLENHTRFNINLPNELLERVKKYQFENHHENRNEAVKELIEKGLNIK